MDPKADLGSINPRLEGKKSKYTIYTPVVLRKHKLIFPLVMVCDMLDLESDDICSGFSRPTWPEKSTTSNAMIDFESDIENL